MSNIFELDRFEHAETLGPVALPAAYEVVADRLRRAIHLGILSDGDRLPSERELAALLGVSRVTVREALRTLQGAGYLTRRRGATNGTEVSVPSHDEAALRAELRARLPEFQEAVEFRAIVESGAARIAARSASRANLALLENAVTALEHVDGVPSFRRADGRFHFAVAHMSGNRLLERSIADARELMFAPTDVLPYTLMVERTRREHAEIYAAIAAGDEAAAETLMERHVIRSHDELLQALQTP